MNDREINCPSGELVMIGASEVQQVAPKDTPSENCVQDRGHVPIWIVKCNPRWKFPDL
jgi:hypothetical protein